MFNDIVRKIVCMATKKKTVSRKKAKKKNPNSGITACGAMAPLGMCSSPRKPGGKIYYV